MNRKSDQKLIIFKLICYGFFFHRELPKLKKDFTVQELKAFNGNQEDGRVLVAVNGNVYDVTKGKRFYGPGK